MILLFKSFFFPGFICFKFRLSKFTNEKFILAGISLFELHIKYENDRSGSFIYNS